MQKLNIRTRIAIVFGIFLLSTSFLQAQNKVITKEQTKENEYLVAAYIWPSCHDDPLGREKLWPEGTGEWEVIKKGDRRFLGHYQPRQPLWGYEMDNDPKVVEKWIDVATDHGVNVFIYDWYWYEGGPFLESALNDGFLKAKNNSKKAGFPGLHIQWNSGGGSMIGGERAKKLQEQVRTMGFSSYALYNMGGFDVDYMVHGANSIKIRERMDEILDVPFFPCVSVGWDDTPRKPDLGDRHVTRFHNTPESFATLLYKAKKYADSRPGQPKLITINAWNEWVEASYLLPDMLHGFGYLEAVKDVFIEGKYDRY